MLEEHIYSLGLKANSLVFLKRWLWTNACTERLNVSRFYPHLQCLFKPGELSPKEEYDSSHFAFTDTPHCEARSFFWSQWQILGPVLYSSCMQCSHWGHLIRLTSASAPCTECTTKNLGESIIPQFSLPWHPQPAIPFSLWFLFFF